MTGFNRPSVARLALEFKAGFQTCRRRGAPAGPFVIRVADQSHNFTYLKINFRPGAAASPIPRVALAANDKALGWRPRNPWSASQIGQNSSGLQPGAS